MTLMTQSLKIGRGEARAKKVYQGSLPLACQWEGLIQAATVSLVTMWGH